MTLTVTGRHVELSPQVRNQIQLRFTRLERVLHDSAVSAQCIVTKVRQQFVCEVTLHARGDHMLAGIGRHERVMGAVALAIDKVKQQAKKLADRWKKRRRSGQKLSEVAVAAAASAPVAKRKAPVPDAGIVRARRYAVRSLSTEDAAERMGTAAFLVFRQVVSGRVAVVFRRPDGRVGLIEPEG